MKMNKDSHHITIRNQALFCTHCGGKTPLKMPMSVDNMNEKIDAFNTLHYDCEKVWEQPKVDQSKSIEEKMDFWLNQGERGMSAEVIFQNLSGKYIGLNFPHHPHDPDDFRRCYDLLETIPEWKERIGELHKLSPVWKKLVDNWDKLTLMLEEQFKTKKPNGMYEYMNELGC